MYQYYVAFSKHQHTASKPAKPTTITYNENYDMVELAAEDDSNGRDA